MSTIYIDNNKEVKENDLIIETEVTATNEDNLPPNNVIGKDLQAVLKPVNIMEALFVCAKYRIRDNIITTNCVFYDIASMLVTLTLMCYGFYCWFGFTSTLFNCEGLRYFQLVNSMHNYVLLVIGSFLSCCTNIVEKHTNVLFVIKIQDVYRILKKNEILKSFIVLNRVCVIILNFYHIIWMFFSYYVFNSTGRDFDVASYFWIVFDNNILYAMAILKLITKSLKNWVKNAHQMSEYIESPENDCYWNTMFEVYMKILDAYGIFKKTFHHLILFYIIQITARCLSGITIRIEMRKVTFERIKTSAVFAVLSFMSLSWIIKNMLLLILLSVECERLYSAVRDVQTTCIQLANSRGCSDTRRRVCKNIQRVQTASFKKMYACGLFVIDVALSLRVCAFITTYTIVILQFEFL